MPRNLNFAETGMDSGFLAWVGKGIVIEDESGLSAKPARGKHPFHGN